eukprot:Clim_evm12s139 gene=Clim_evmTU12s139
MGNGASQILPDIYLGSLKDAEDLKQIRRYKITHIVSLHERAGFEGEGIDPSKAAIQYLNIRVTDTQFEPLIDHFDKCCKWIHAQRLADRTNNILIHCIAGISRSTTICIAYLAAATDHDVQTVLEAIRTARPFVQPNKGFLEQLEVFENRDLKKARESLAEMSALANNSKLKEQDHDHIKTMIENGRKAENRRRLGRTGDGNYSQTGLFEV